MIRKCHPCQQLQLTDRCFACHKPTEEINSFESVIIHHLLTILDELNVTYFAVPIDLIEIQIENRVRNFLTRLYVHNDVISIVVTIFTKYNFNIKTQTFAYAIPLADPNCFQQFHTVISKLL